MDSSTAALLDRQVPPAVARRTVVLLGNPNTGKTTVFNRLCGARAKTSNFPGTTTSTRTGRADFGALGSIECVDLPGIYSLALDSPESRIAREVLKATRGSTRTGWSWSSTQQPHAQPRSGRSDASRLQRASRRRAQHGRHRAAARAHDQSRSSSRRSGRPRRPDGRATGDGLDALKRAIADVLTAPRTARSRGPAARRRLDSSNSRRGPTSVGANRRGGRRSRRRHVHRAARSRVHASRARTAHVRCDHGGPLLDAVRARDCSDGPDRGHLCDAG